MEKKIRNGDDYEFINNNVFFFFWQNNNIVFVWLFVCLGDAIFAIKGKIKKTSQYSYINLTTLIILVIILDLQIELNGQSRFSVE
jgi:bacteriorhodopsin